MGSGVLGIGEGGTRCSHGLGLGKNHLSFLDLSSIICLENNSNTRNIGLHWPFLAWNVCPQHRHGPREPQCGSRVTALAPEDAYVPTRGWELLICGSYPASVFYLAHSISQVLISSLCHIKSELLVSLEKSDSIAPLNLHSPQPASVQVSPLPHTHALWTGRPCPSVSASCTLPNCAKSLRLHPCRGSASRAVLCGRVCLRSQHPFAVRGVGSKKPILPVDKRSYHPHAWSLALGLTGCGDTGTQGLESFS